MTFQIGDKIIATKVCGGGRDVPIGTYGVVSVIKPSNNTLCAVFPTISYRNKFAGSIDEPFISSAKVNWKERYST